MRNSIMEKRRVLRITATSDLTVSNLGNPVLPHTLAYKEEAPPHTAPTSTDGSRRAVGPRMDRCATAGGEGLL